VVPQPTSVPVPAPPSVDAGLGQDLRPGQKIRCIAFADCSPDLGQAIEMLDEGDRRLLEEHRVLSKAASGGGFLVPTSTADQMLGAIRVAGPVGQLARESNHGRRDVQCPP
jgi:hypothetical protein